MRIKGMKLTKPGELRSFAAYPRCWTDHRRPKPRRDAMEGRALCCVASLLTGMLSSGSLGAAQPLPDSLLAQLRAGARGLRLTGVPVSVPLVGSPTLPLVPTYLNGRGPFRFLIDLGSNVVILRRTVADAVNARLLVDRPASDIVRLYSVELGDARFEEVTAGVYDELDVDGVLGYNLLQASSFTLDYPGKQLILHRLSLPEPDNTTVFSYEVVDRLPYVTIHIGPDSLSVNLDTGAQEFMTVPPALQARLPWDGVLKTGPVVSNNQTGSTQVLRGRLKLTPRLGSIKLPVTEVYVNPDAEDSWLGSAAMQHAAWIFDPANRRLKVIWGVDNSLGPAGCPTTRCT
jgi:predicted aspartyl protease